MDDGVGTWIHLDIRREEWAVGALDHEQAGVEGGAVDAHQEHAVREVDAAAAVLLVQRGG